MPATFSSRSRCPCLSDTSEAAFAIDSSFVQSSCTISSLPLLLLCSCCSAEALSGFRQLAMTLHHSI